MASQIVQFGNIADDSSGGKEEDVYHGEGFQDSNKHGGGMSVETREGIAVIGDWMDTGIWWFLMGYKPVVTS